MKTVKNMASLINEILHNQRHQEQKDRAMNKAEMDKIRKEIQPAMHENLASNEKQALDWQRCQEEHATDSQYSDMDDEMRDRSDSV